MNNAKKQDLSRFIKESNKTEPKYTRSIVIFEKHRDFVDSNQLNLSKLVRAYLDQLIAQDKPKRP